MWSTCPNPVAGSWLIGSSYSSKVFAQDIFTTVFKEDPMSQGAGRRYRYGVLEKGGSQPEMKTLTDFLGRDVRMEPFYEDLGLAV